MIKGFSVNVRTLIPNDFYDSLFKLDSEQKLFDFFTKKQDLIFAFAVFCDDLQKAKEFEDDFKMYLYQLSNKLMYHVSFDYYLPKLIDIIKTKDKNKLDTIHEYLQFMEIALMLSTLYREDGEASFCCVSTDWELLDKNDNRNCYVRHLTISNNKYYMQKAQLETLFWKHIDYIKAKNKPKYSQKRNPIDHKLRHEVFKRDNYKCKECGATNQETQLHVDHIISVMQGGSDELNNLQTLCSTCNLAKSGKSYVGGNK